MTPIDSRRVRLVADGVVASYIHEISARTAPRTAPVRRHARLAQTRRALRRREDPVHARRDYQAA
jgi:hypothetical protein